MDPSAGPAPADAAGAAQHGGNGAPTTTTTAAAGRNEQTQQQQQQASAINPFSFNPQLLLADLSNAALDACADGFDALERQLLQALPLERNEKAALRDGVGQLWAAVLASLNDAATNFERVAAATALHVPAELSAEGDGVDEEEEEAGVAAAEGGGDAAATAAAPTANKTKAFPPATEEDEAAVDAELEALRAALAEAREDAGRLRRELSAAARDRAAAAGAAPAMRPLGAALASHRASVLEDVAAVSGAAARLRPLMARCEQLRNAALAAARQRAALVGGGGAGGEGAAAAASGADDAPAAAKSVREMMVDTGAGADQLRELCEAVGGGGGEVDAAAGGGGGGGGEAADA